MHYIATMEETEGAQGGINHFEHMMFIEVDLIFKDLVEIGFHEIHNYTYGFKGVLVYYNILWCFCPYTAGMSGL